jgi:hypothetical protein
MSSIMWRRSGLTASTKLVEVTGGSGLEVGVLDPSILKPASRPVTSHRAQRVTVHVAPPPARAGSFFGLMRSLAGPKSRSAAHP